MLFRRFVAGFLVALAVWGGTALSAAAQSGAQALVLDGTDDQVVLSQSAAFDFTGSFTVAFWLKADGFATPNVPIVAKGSGSWAIRQSGAEGTLVFVSTHGGSTSRLEGRTPVDDGQWHHIAVVYNAATGDKTLYVDGRRDGTATAMGPLAQNTAPVRLGAAAAPPTATLAAQLDDIRFWSAARSRDRIRHSLWHPLEGDEANLLAYYPANTLPTASGATVLADRGPSGLDGTVQGDARVQPAPTPQALQPVVASDALYEDRVELRWPDPATIVPAAALLRVTRNGTVLAYRSTGDSTYVDDTGASDVAYAYCLDVTIDGQTYTYACDDGTRSFRPAANVRASDEMFTDQIALTWRDASQVEAGYRVYRDGQQVAVLEANVQQYADTSSALAPLRDHRYCVAPYDDDGEGQRVCDAGRLAEVVPVASVEATTGTYSDRVVVTWQDPGPGTSGYVITRNDTSIATLNDPSQQQFVDRASVPGATATYCVQRVEGTITSRPLCASGSAGTLAAPTAVQATDATYDDRVALQWTDAATAEARYLIYRQPGLPTATPDTAAMTRVATLASDAAAYTDRAAVPGQVYTYCAVAATNGNARTQLTGTDPVGRTVDACDTGRRSVVLAPTNVAATDSVAEDRVRITWNDPATRSSFYRIYRRNAGASTLQAIATPSKQTRTYVDENAPPNARHEYCVSAFTEQGNESARTCTFGSREVNKPTGVTATDNEREDRVRVEWADNSRVEAGYGIYRRPITAEGQPTTPDSTLVHTTLRNEQVLIDTTGVPGQRYRYSVVTAIAFAGDTLATSAGADAGMRTLQPPTAVEASDGTSETEVVVTWTDQSAAEDGYRITRIAADGTEAVAGQVPDNVTAFSDTTGLLGVTYTYQVVAFDDDGTSTADSDEGATMILPPGSVTASTSYTDRVTITWVDQSTREDAYRVLRDGEALTTLAANQTTYTDASLAAGAVASYCVETLSASGEASERMCDEGERLGSGSGITQAQTVALANQIQGGDTDFNEYFGNDLDATDEYLGIGHRGQREDLTGTAHIYKRTGGTWEEMGELGAVSPNSYGRFGLDLGIGNGAIVVGESKVNEIVQFTPTDDGWGNPDLIVDDDYDNGVGDEMDIAVDDSLAILAYGGFNGTIVIRNLKSGDTVDLFNGTLFQTEDTGTPWEETAVAILGTRVLIGDTDRNFVYYHERAPDGTWPQQFSVSGNAQGFDESFGGSVALTERHVIVGAPNASGGDGRVYIFNRQSELVQTLQPAGDGTNNAQFGTDLHAEPSGLLLVGAPGQAAGGRAHLFQLDARGIYGRSIIFQAEGDPAGDGFGRTVTFGAGDVIIGAPDANSETGAVYVSSLAAPPEGVVASDGAYRNRVSLSWSDASADEDGYRIYRDGTLIATTGPNETSYRDTDAAPGNTYAYCVTAYETEVGFETDRICNRGWRAPDGAISGRTQLQDGSAFAGVNICLSPSPNGALVLDGAGGYVAIQDLAGNLPPAFTLSAWVKPALGGSAKDAVWGLNTNEGGNKFTLRYNHDTQRFEHYDTDNQTQASADTFAPNAWHHVALSVAADGTGQLIVNGTLQASFMISSSVRPDANDLFSLGQEYDEAGGERQASDFFAGQIDDVRLWHTNRTAAQVEAHRFEPLDGTEDDLMAYWPLDERGGTAGANVASDDGAFYAVYQNGAGPAEQGAPLNACVRTGADGTYSISDLRYGDGITFAVIPQKPPHVFQPTRTSVTLSPQTPVQNQVRFTDQTSLPVSGTIQYAGTQCPATGVNMLVDGEQEASTDTQGAFTVGVIPGTHTLRPVLDDNASGTHTFTPEQQTLDVTGARTDVNFEDTTTRRLTVDVHGGCGFSVGIAELKIRSTNGCYTRTVETNAQGVFTAELPPQEYTVQVTGVRDVPDPSQKVAIEKFFAQRGAINVDLAPADTTVELIYRAPIQVAVKEWPEAASCSNVSVPVVKRNQELNLRIQVAEDYGNGNLCPVEDASVTVYDELADRGDDPVTATTDSTGAISYHTFGRSPNLIAGRVVNGIDRSYQKSLSVTAEVSTRRDATTRWAIVEGLRAREGTQFITRAVELPVAVLRDPPGDGSYSYLSEGTEVCSSTWTESGLALSNATAVTAGVNTEVQVGWWGFYADVEVLAVGGVGVTVSQSSTNGERFSVCQTTTERLQTSAAPGATGRSADVFMGAGINFVFATSDVLKVLGEDKAACEIRKSQTVSFQPDSISTTYAYTRQHIEETLIPELQDLKTDDREGRLDYDDVIALWENILYESDRLASEAELIENRSFSSGNSFQYEETRTQRSATYSSVFTSVATRIFAEVGVLKPAVATLATETVITPSDASGSEQSNQQQRTWGYVLSDDDAGDSYTVDIKKDPRYGTPVFQTRSGTSSCPFEPAREPFDTFSSFAADRAAWSAFEGDVLTTRRDKVELNVSNGISRQVSVAPDEAATFGLTLVNDSPSDETRSYAVRLLNESNPKGAIVKANGAAISGGSGLPFEVGPGKARNLTLTVERGARGFRYDSLAVMAYPPCDLAAGGEVPSTDTVYVSVTFQPPSSPIALESPAPGFAINRATKDAPFDVSFSGFSVDTTDTGHRLSEVGVFIRPAIDLNGGFPPLQTTANGDSSAADSLRGPRYLKGEAARALFRRIENGAAAKATQGVEALEDWSQTLLVATRQNILQLNDCANEACDLSDITTYFERTQYRGPDGVYEIAAYTKTTNAEGTVTGAYVAEPRRIIVDTKRPRVHGTPEPADGLLTAGDDIAVTFDETVACATVRANENVTLAYADSTVGGRIPITPTCDGRVLYLQPRDPEALAQAEDQRLVATVTAALTEDGGVQRDSAGPLSLTDRAGNPLPASVDWRFTVQQRGLTWTPAADTLRLVRGTTGQVSTRLTNFRTQLVDYGLTASGDALTIEGPTAAPDPLAPGASRTVTINVAADRRPGTYIDTVRVTGVGARAALYRLTTIIERPEPAVRTPQQVWAQSTPQQHVDLRWTPGDKGAARYQVYRGSNARFDTTGARVATVRGQRSQYVDSTAQVGATHYYRLVARAATGEMSAPSEAASIFLYPRTVAAHTQRSFAGGDDPQDFRLVALPGAVQQRLTEALNGTPGDDWTAYADRGTSEDPFVEIDAASDRAFTPGRGYWLRQREAWTVDKTVQTVDLRGDTVAVIDVHDGWNIIANPLDKDVAWAAVEQANAANLQALWRFAGRYTRAQTFASATTGEAFYFLNDRGLDSLVVPYPGAPFVQQTSSEKSTSKASAARTLTLATFYDGTHTGQATIQLAPDARVGRDALDQVAPPARFEGPRLRLPVADPPSPRQRWLAHEARPAGTDGQRVNLTLHAPAGSHVRIDARTVNALDVPAVRLVERATGRMIDLTQRQSFTLQVEHAQTPLVLLMGTTAFVEEAWSSIVPPTVRLRANYPNPFRTQTTIEYAVPKAGPVRLDVYDLLGRRVATLVNATQKAGWHRVRWNATAGRQRLASGVYFGRLRVGGEVRTHKMVIVR
ncbi:LamG-like jellyroll fold domain-containing protein [Salisaeta longa]|uniref:LamG-like jellyroll fold domain-containing protein n=1 Tax=Salisaeta longa TaxID=503170 RepID=UPI00146CE2FE|nr:LamG-like jellyroll fold domain-containing protein [Salisaeta longa]